MSDRVPRGRLAKLKQRFSSTRFYEMHVAFLTLMDRLSDCRGSYAEPVRRTRDGLKGREGGEGQVGGREEGATCLC